MILWILYNSFERKNLSCVTSDFLMLAVDLCPYCCNNFSSAKGPAEWHRGTFNFLTKFLEIEKSNNVFTCVVP